ncbi:centaurin-gamma-1A isoform X3 [Ixodes scapularis]|uniref:centaurin-gamma-1A isoform X3 n=1 Tax=Ixodes scapularis TaxID=6945 RepID=UPI001A9CC774|nr:centaurin-gamma-1A isoform X3 [Ixodes scapularis]
MEKFFLRALGRSYTYCCADTAPPTAPGPISGGRRGSSTSGQGGVTGGGRRFAEATAAILRHKSSKDQRKSTRKRHSFVNSQEWTLSRSVPDIRLGIVGSLSSGKSALVHRYLTGSYMQDESPEGGRFKKEIVIDGQSYLLLIRDEGGPPELQFSCWVDAVIFVFSLENEASFSAIYSYYMRMAHFRNAADLPLILVGTQDAISESNPRVIDDLRARKLASDLKRCSYYETAATYGLNVERVFQDACQRIVQLRMASSLTPTNSRPGTPVGGAGAALRPSLGHLGASNNGYASTGQHGREAQSQQQQQASAQSTANATAALINSYNSLHGATGVGGNFNQASLKREIQKLEKADRTTAATPAVEGAGGTGQAGPAAGNNNNNGRDRPEFVTPCSTPTTARKTRRRSNLFTPLKKADEEKRQKNGEMGSGRVIPVRQGYLYKKSIKALNKEWKKKYVTLTSDGRLTYHPSLHDYMEDVHGKEIPLMHTTVKIPGQKPRGSRVAGSQVNDLTSDVGTLSLAGGVPFFKYRDRERNRDPTTFDPIREGQDPGHSLSSGMLNGSETHLIPAVPNTNPKLETPIVKKRHRRMKSTGAKNFEAMEDSDGYEFIIVSLDNKQWQFEASSGDDREGWVSAIEQQILTSLQGNESSKAKGRMNSIADTATSVQAIRTAVPGNSHCADCDTPHPDWASLNLGTLICIECSGIHRNLGSHMSRVRSLDLDDWPPGNVAVMMALGNAAANALWEGSTRGCTKPCPTSGRDEKERWIRAKYEQREFLTPLANPPTAGQLREAVCRGDVRQAAALLAHAAPRQTELVNAPGGPRDSRTPLHLAATLGHLALVQLLLWNNANAKAVDSDGRTPLAYAKGASSPEVHELLLHSGGPDANQLSTLSRRRGSLSKRSDVFDKLPASII